MRVFNCEMDYANPERTALAGIEATAEFFKSIGMPSTLRECGLEEKHIEEMAVKCTNYGKRTLPGLIELGKDEIADIYRICL